MQRQKARPVVGNDRVMEAYYADIRDSDILPAEEERRLFTAYRTCGKCGHVTPALKKSSDKASIQCVTCGARRNLSARDRLIKGAIRFVLKVAKDYARRTKGPGHSADLFQALVSAGNVGLMIAVDRFDLDKGTRFLTYAAWWIREEILAELDNMGIVRVPAYRQKALRARRRGGEDVDSDEGSVTMEELSEVDRRHKDDGLEDAIFSTYGSALIFQALQDLGLRGRDRYIVLAYFGMREEPKNLQQLSTRLGISSERVRQIKKITLERLRDHLESRQVSVTDDVISSS